MSNMSWKDILKESLGPVTEYHGTLDLNRVLKFGINGSSPQSRSKRYVPVKLREADKITYTAKDLNAVIEFIKRRAKQTKTKLKDCGVVGVMGTTLPPAIEHDDGMLGVPSYVREGGIPRKYLVDMQVEFEE
tara:strand:- start:1473 stop:1868 length:396 start_codon:yes stop_codon:yes gene_type:complete